MAAAVDVACWCTCCGWICWCCMWWCCICCCSGPGPAAIGPGHHTASSRPPHAPRWCSDMPRGRAALALQRPTLANLDAQTTLARVQLSPEPITDPPPALHPATPQCRGHPPFTANRQPGRQLAFIRNGRRRIALLLFYYCDGLPDRLRANYDKHDPPFSSFINFSAYNLLRVDCPTQKSQSLPLFPQIRTIRASD